MTSADRIDGPGDSGGPGDPSLSRPTAASLQMSRFFVVPAIIVGVCVLGLAVAGGLYVLLRERQDPAAYIDQVATGSGNRRWQAAYELSKIIAANEGTVDDATAQRLVEVYRRAADDAPEVRRYLILALGRIRRPGSLEALRSALKDPDAESRIYAMWGLASQGDRASAPEVAGGLNDEDPGVRKMAAYALGFLQDPAAIPALTEALHDRAPDVRWNAAVALARLGDASGVDVLLEMVDRPRLEALEDEDGNPIMDGERIRQAMITGITALTMLGDPRGAERIAELARSEPDLRVRDAAVKAGSGEAALAPEPPGGLDTPPSTP